MKRYKNCETLVDTRYRRRQTLVQTYKHLEATRTQILVNIRGPKNFKLGNKQIDLHSFTPNVSKYVYTNSFRIIYVLVPSSFYGNLICHYSLGIYPNSSLLLIVIISQVINNKIFVEVLTKSNMVQEMILMLRHYLIEILD